MALDPLTTKPSSLISAAAAPIRAYPEVKV
jgi:hypothetical protein